METEAEELDWMHDTWHVFAPFTAIPGSIVYCGANLVVALVVRGISKEMARFAPGRELGDSSKGDSLGNGES